MSYQDILDTVTWNIARPDMAARVSFHTFQALRQAHNLGFFQKDIQETNFADIITAEKWTWVDPDSNVVARIALDSPVFATDYDWRRLYEIQIFSDAAYLNQTWQTFKNRAEDPLYDDFKRLWKDYYAQVGRVLQINFSSTPAYGILRYFAYPTEASLDASFMVTDYPMYVSNLATQQLAKMLGLSDLSESLKAEIRAQEDQILTNEITVK